jgi:thioredoxin reductase
MKYDAIVVGGSFAGLTAALCVARARRTVCVIDDGAPRNRFTGSSHGFLTRDGSDPHEMLAQARSQLEVYPTVRFVSATASDASGQNDDFLVTLDTGEALTSRRIVLAFGVQDDLPDLPGLAERWGKTVLACPYCHGYEFADRQIGVLQAHPMSAMQAVLIADWGPVTLYLNGQSYPDDAMMTRLSARGVRIEPASVRALEGDGDELSAIVLDDGRRLPIDALYVAPPVAVEEQDRGTARLCHRGGTLRSHHHNGRFKDDECHRRLRRRRHRSSEQRVDCGCRGGGGWHRLACWAGVRSHAELIFRCGDRSSTSRAVAWQWAEELVAPAIASVNSDEPIAALRRQRWEVIRRSTWTRAPTRTFPSDSLADDRLVGC